MENPARPGCGERSVRPLDARGIAFALLLLLALAARVGYVLDTWKFIPFQDTQDYDWLGQGLARGHGWVIGSSAYRPPGYPVFLAFVDEIIGVPQSTYVRVTTEFSGWTAVRLVEAFLAVGTVGLLAWLAHQLAGRRVALVALGLGAVYMPLIVVGVSMMSESLLVPLVLAAVNCAVRVRTAQRRTRWIVLAGLFAGLSALTRGNGIVVGIGLAFVVWTERPWWSRRSLASPLLLPRRDGSHDHALDHPQRIRPTRVRPGDHGARTHLGGHLQQPLGEAPLPLGGPHSYSDYRATRNNKKLTEAQDSSQLTPAVFKYIGRHPEAVPVAMFWNTVRLFDLEGRFDSRQTARTDVDATSSVADLSVYSFWIVGLLAIVGLFTPAVRHMPRSVRIIPFLLWLSVAPITTGTPRFRAVLDPWFILLAASAIVSLADRAAEALVLRRVPVTQPA